MIHLLLILLLVSHSTLGDWCFDYSRRVSFTSVGVGPNITTAFLDVQGRAAKSSPFYDEYTASLGECVENPQSGISTCSGGKLYYPYHIKYSVVDDNYYPDRVDNWVAEEYGWATIVPILDAFDMHIASHVTYYNPKNTSECEMYYVRSIKICGTNEFKPATMVLSVTGDLRAEFSKGNYTLVNGKWLVNMTYRNFPPASEYDEYLFCSLDSRYLTMGN